MKQKTVTRTFPVTVAEITALTQVNGEDALDKVYFEVTGKYKTDKALLKALRASFESDDMQIIKATTKEVKYKKYEMTENDFIENATEV